MRTHMSGWLLASCAIALCGCQSWSQVGQGIPGGSRVPPPGTGTYQVPSNYYNNGVAPKTGSVSTNTPAPTADAAQVRTASAQSLPSTGAGPSTSAGVATASWQVPSVDQMRSGINNRAATAVNNASQRANDFVQSGTSRAAATLDQYTNPILAGESPQSTPQSTPQSAPAASRSLSDHSQDIGDGPALDWQPPQ